MLEREFLIKMARDRELSPNQEQIFIMRFAEEKDYEEIAIQLRTSAGACLKQMGQVYKKFAVSGNHRGKENRLRISLLNQFRQLEEEKAAENLPLQRFNSAQSPAGNRGILDEKMEPIAFIDSYKIPALISHQNNSYASRLKLQAFTPATPPNEGIATPRQNLPAPDRTRFIGRETEMARLLEMLSCDREVGLSHHTPQIVSVNGLPGVGKTALVLEAAYRCLQASRIPEAYPSAPTFDAIIFTSAKENHLTSAGILPRLQRDRTLGDICRAIARTLNRPDIASAEPLQQLDSIREYLSKIPTLLILDNLESVDNQQEILSFLYDLPRTVKVIITTREQALFAPIYLESLREIDGSQLIEYQAREKGIFLDSEQCQIIYRETSGLPLASGYVVNQLAFGYSLSDVLERIKDSSSELAKFIFNGSIKSLTGQPSLKLLMATATFNRPATREAIAIAAGITDSAIVADGLAKLQQLSLLKQQEGRYYMLELIRTYAIALSKTNVI